MNSGHGPGYRYDEPVGPPGGLLAGWILIAVIAAISWLFGL